MRQLLMNIVLFLVCLTLFCLAVPQVPTSDAHHSDAPLIAQPVKQIPKDSTSMLWKKDSTLRASATMLSKKAAE